jgi:hypothetical protein
MNMKRLLALFAVLGAFLVCNFPAQAQTIPKTCVLVPSFVYDYNCGNQTQGGTDANNASTMANANHTAAYVLNNLVKEQVKRFWFPTYASFHSSTLGSGVTVSSTTPFAVTVLTATDKVPQYIAEFGTSSVNAQVTNTAIAHNLTYQFGVAYDSLLGQVAKDGVVTYPFPTLSSNPDYSSELTYDWNTFNADSACILNGSGVFNNQMDPSDNYICTSNGTGGTLSKTYDVAPYNQAGGNQKLLAYLYPQPFNSTPTIFYEEYAQLRGGVTFPINHYTGLLACSSLYVQTVEQEGRTIVAGDRGGEGTLTVSCPVPAHPTDCFQKFDSSTPNQQAWPSGDVFDCTPSGSTLGSPIDQITSALYNLGALGTQNPGALKQLLRTAHNRIYFFNTNSAYTAAFALAGVSTAGTSITGLNDLTVPDGADPVWYILVNALSGGNTQNHNNTNLDQAATIKQQFFCKFGETSLVA